jgi:hypothetical protein
VIIREWEENPALQCQPIFLVITKDKIKLATFEFLSVAIAFFKNVCYNILYSIFFYKKKIASGFATKLTMRPFG